MCILWDRKCPHCARRNMKTQLYFYSPVLASVYQATLPSDAWQRNRPELEYISTVRLIRHENGAFGNRSLDRGNLKTQAFCFCVDQKKNVLKTELFRNVVVDMTMRFSCPHFPQTQIWNDRWLFSFLIPLFRCKSHRWNELVCVFFCD